MRVLKYYAENKAQLEIRENKVNENEVLYCKALRCETIKNNKTCFPYVKLTNLLSF